MLQTIGAANEALCFVNVFTCTDTIHNHTLESLEKIPVENLYLPSDNWRKDISAQQAFSGPTHDLTKPVLTGKSKYLFFNNVHP